MKFEIKKMINKVKFNVVKHSPEILMGIGITGVITSTVLACRSTLKVKDILEDKDTNMNNVKEVLAEGREDYTEEDARKDKTIIMTTTAIRIMKLYAPSVIIGAGSIACLLESHNVMRNRNAGLAAALAATTESFKQYRERVTAKYGDEVDKEMRYGIKKEKKEKDGKKTKEEITVGCDEKELSGYARYFNENNINWTDDPQYNMMFLRQNQNWANDKLISQGYLYLNDVYDALGFPKTKAGQVVGWVYDPKNNERGDNYIDFGIYDLNVRGYRDEMANDTIAEERQDFINGYRNSILLDFNVDGNIWETMGE